MIFLLFLCVPLMVTGSKLLMKQFTISSLEVDHSSYIYLMVTSVIAMLFFATKGGFHLRPNLPTLIYATALAILAIMSNLLTLKIIEKMDLVTASVFSGAGAIVIPFLFGTFFLNETVTKFKIISLLLLLMVVTKPALKREKAKRKDWTGYLYCILLFFVGGSATILYKLFAVADNVMSTEVFCFWANVIILPYVGFVVLRTERHSFLFDIRQMKKSAYIFAAMTVLVGNSADLLQIYVLKYMDLTVYTLLNSPISLILTALLSRLFYREKMTKEKAFSVGLSIVALVLNSL